MRFHSGKIRLTQSRARLYEFHILALYNNRALSNVIVIGEFDQIYLPCDDKYSGAD